MPERRSVVKNQDGLLRKLIARAPDALPLSAGKGIGPRSADNVGSRWHAGDKLVRIGPSFAASITPPRSRLSAAIGNVVAH